MMADIDREEKLIDSMNNTIDWEYERIPIIKL